MSDQMPDRVTYDVWRGQQALRHNLATVPPDDTAEEQERYARNLGWLLSEVATAAPPPVVQPDPAPEVVTDSEAVNEPMLRPDPPLLEVAVCIAMAPYNDEGRISTAARTIALALAEANVRIRLGLNPSQDMLMELALPKYASDGSVVESINLSTTLTALPELAAAVTNKDALDRFLNGCTALFVLGDDPNLVPLVNAAIARGVFPLTLSRTGSVSDALLAHLTAQGADIVTPEQRRIFATEFDLGSESNGVQAAGQFLRAALPAIVGQPVNMSPLPIPPPPLSEPAFRVLVRGFTYTDEYLPPGARAFPTALGRALAQENIGVDVGGWGGVRTMLVRAYAEALPANTDLERNGPRIYLSTGESLNADLPPKVVTRVSADREYATLKEAAAMVVIGGGSGTKDVVQRALDENGPVLVPVPGTGGIADWLIEELPKRIDPERIPESWRKDYLDWLTSGISSFDAEAVSRVIDLLKKIGAEPARMNDIRFLLTEGERTAIREAASAQSKVLVEWRTRTDLPSSKEVEGLTLELHFEEAHTPRDAKSKMPRFAVMARLIGTKAQRQNAGDPTTWSIPPFETPQLPVTGTGLYKTLSGANSEFHEAVLSAIQTAENNNEKLHIRIVMRADVSPTLQGMPWEMLVQPKKSADPLAEENRPFAVRPTTPFSHTLPLTDHAIRPVMLKEGEKIRLLIAVATAHDITTFEGMKLAEVDPADADAVAEYLRTYASQTMEVTVFGGRSDEWASLDALAKLLDDAANKGKPYHALHLICHGLPGGAVDDPRAALVLPDVNGKAVRVTDTQFAAAIGPREKPENHGPWVVTLGSCWTALPDGGYGLRGIARRLVAAGVPIVAAMQEQVETTTAEIFAREFYLNLVKTGRADVAMNSARATLYDAILRAGKSPGDDPSWWHPVLFQVYNTTPLFQTAKGLRQGATTAIDSATAELDAYPDLPPPPIPYEKVADPRVSASVMASRLAPALDSLPMGMGSTASSVSPGIAGPGGVQSFLEAVLRPGVEQAAAEASPSRYKPPKSPLSLILNEFKVALQADQLSVPSNLDFPDDVLRQLLAALESGRHIILTGPPGTGKTTLAIAVANFAARQEFCATPSIVTASVDWTTFDTLGGNVPTPSGALRFRPGVVPKSIEEGRWLILDEINRADIDKAFGEMFTLLSGQPVSLPFDVSGRPVRLFPFDHREKKPEVEGHDYYLERNWRIIGTMNVYDRASLFAMSAALKRRFAFVNIPLPRETSYKSIFDGQFQRAFTDDNGDRSAEFQNLRDELKKLLIPLDIPIEGASQTIATCRGIGPALSKDICSYLARTHPTGTALDIPRALADIVTLFLLPQWEGLEQDTVGKLTCELYPLLGKHVEMVCRILFDLYPYVDGPEYLRTARKEAEEAEERAKKLARAAGGVS